MHNSAVPVVASLGAAASTSQTLISTERQLVRQEIPFPTSMQSLVVHSSGVAQDQEILPVAVLHLQQQSRHHFDSYSARQDKQCKSYHTQITQTGQTITITQGALGVCNTIVSTSQSSNSSSEFLPSQLLFTTRLHRLETNDRGNGLHC